MSTSESPATHLHCIVDTRPSFNVKYVEEAEKTAPTPVAPEFRLIPLLYAAPLFAVSFFWLGGTSATSISIASPILAITLLGACVLFIFLACFNYLVSPIDTTVTSH
jgi:hypothetical protein